MSLYSTDHTIDEIVLGVINDGSGADCGMSYAQRCSAAELGLAEYHQACQRYGRLMYTRFDSQPPNRAQVIEAANIVQAYYRQHMKESA